MKKRPQLKSMSRLIERAEFEKRLADYSVGITKALKHLAEHLDAQQARLSALEAKENTPETVQ